MSSRCNAQVLNDNAPECLIWFDLLTYSLKIDNYIKEAHPRPCNGAHSQDGKRYLVSERTAPICFYWNSSASYFRFMFNVPQYKRIFISFHPHDTGCPFTVCSLLWISKELMWQTLACANVPWPPASHHHDVANSCWCYLPHCYKSFYMGPNFSQQFIT